MVVLALCILPFPSDSGGRVIKELPITITSAVVIQV
jgi:hypothetical protein